MKLRKILARGVAIAACAAMLSTNVLAASELTITTAEAGGKLAVTISGAVEGQVTFLAVNDGTELSDSTSAADMQYIAQEAKATDTDTVVTFAQREGGASIVDLYAGGENVTEVATATAYVEAYAALTAASKAFTIESTSLPADDAGWKTYLTGKIAVDYAAIGDAAATEVALSEVTAADFTVAAGAATDNVYPIAVSYKGIAAGTVNVTAVVPESPVASIAATGITGEITVYVANAAEFTNDDAKAAIKDEFAEFKVIATHADTTTSEIAFNDLTITYAAGVATIAYGEFVAPETVTINVITKAITAAEVKTAAPASVVLEVAEGTTVDAAYVEANIVAKVAAFEAEYVWNDSSRTPVPANELTYAAAAAGEGYTVTITAAQAAFATPVTVAVTIQTIAASEEKTAIKGKVLSTDSTGLVADFAGAVPVGAVVTAINYNDEAMGNVTGTAEAFAAVSTVVDADGNFELEVEPGKYTVIIAHSKYAIYGGEVYISRTILDANSMRTVELSEGVEEDLGTITLKYTYFGDLNLDGTLNAGDYSTFAQGFGSTVE